MKNTTPDAQSYKLGQHEYSVAPNATRTHSLGRKIVSVTVSDTTDDTQWETGVTFTSTTVVTLDFGITVPTTNQFTVLVVG